MLYSQPLALRFGVEIIRHLGESKWQSLDIAVAWVRESGVAHLRAALEGFLARGGEISIVVGLDLHNTTEEGLASLLALSKFGKIETFVYHNESGGIFHPKLYLLRNKKNARLIVGSNNLTQAGLFINVEAGLQVDAAMNEGIILHAMDALKSWKDLSTGLTRRLDEATLKQLVEEDYIRGEATTRAAIQRARKPKTGSAPKRLFVSKTFTAPPIPGRQTQPNTPRAPRTPLQKAITAPPSTEPQQSSAGAVVLLRMRRSRGTQVQLPKALLSTAFFKDVTALTSSHDGVTHSIRPVVSARGGGEVNTNKMEMPETRNFDDIFVRVEKTDTGARYEVYNLGTPQGNQIRAALLDGREDGSTLTTKSDMKIATWWRFI